MERYHPTQCCNRISFIHAICSCVFLSIASGCQQYAKITWDPPKSRAAEKQGQLVVGDLSTLNRKWELWEGKPGSKATIGKHTFTVFALPVGNINAHESTPVKESFDKAVRGH